MPGEVTFTPFDTIAAVSTPPGEGGIGIVRMSGPEAFAIARGMFSPLKKSETLERPVSFALHLGRIENGGRIVDEVLVSFMKAPRTYTREDVVEINCHGGAVAVNEVLRLALAAGARPAEPGEFTMRAFVNGRIDLAQAEAVLDIVRARTNSSLEAAQNQLKGNLSARIGALADALKGILVELEASIDFAEEEEVAAPTEAAVRGRVASVLGGLDSLISSYDEGRVLRDGVLTALVGRPNVGKSSLFNAFLRFDRAIVTPIPGTTRDAIEEQLNLGGVPFILADTAGITESANLVEREGVRRSLSYLERADLVLLVFDGASPLEEEDVEVARAAKGRPHIAVLNKADLPLRFPWGELAERSGLGPDFVAVSAADGSGLKELERRMREKVIGGSAGADYSLMVTNARHHASLVKARAELSHALETFAGSSQPEGSAEVELVAYDVRSALDLLGEITGAVTRADILDAIFGSFCIGK